MSAINTLTPRVSGVYFLKSGQQRDVFGLQDLHPNSNINKLEIYLEDGDGKNTVFINFRNDKKSAITSHWFPTIFMGYVNHTLIGEEIPRTFAKYVLFVSTMVTKWNLNGHAPLPISSTVVQVGGDRLIGLFGTLNDLNNEYNQSQKEKLYLNNKVAYVYEENNNYGFYKLILDQSNYVWTKIDNPLDAYNIVDTKQYNILGLTIQKGNAPTVKSQITISDEYIRFMLSTLAEIKDSVIFVENELGDKDGGAVGNTVWGEINYLLFWVNKIMTDSSNISYDNQDSGLTATNIQDAIDELENIMFKKDGSVKATGDFDLNNKGIYDVSQISVGEINAQTQGGFIDVNDEMRFYDKTIGREGASDYEFVVKKQLDTELSKKLDKSGGTMTDDLDMNGNDISYVKELQVEKVTTGGGYSIEIEDDIDMRDNIIENVDIVKFAYGLQIQRSADKKEIRFYVPRTGGYGLIFKIVDGELRLHDGVKITNLADGTHIKDAVTKGQLDLKADQSTTYTKNEVNNLISQIPKFKIIKVSVLPTENIDLMAIYVLGNAEYIYIENETRWEKLGTLEVDLNDYYDKTEIANLLLGKVNTTRTINGKELKNDIVLNAIDIDIENGAFADKTVEEALDTLSVITQNIPRIEKPVLENEIEVILEPMGTVNTQFDMTKESIENGTLWIDDVKVVEKGVALDGYILTEIQGGYELTGGGYDIAFYYESGEYGSKGDIVDLNAKSGTLKFLVNIKTYVDYEIDKLDLGDKNVQSDWAQEVNTADDYIKNKPAIPTKISDLTNDKGYITDYTETDPIFTAWDKSTGISITKSQVSDLIEATQSLSGLMSATDKERLDALHALLEEDTENNVVDSINEILAIFNNYPEGADLVTALAGKVDKVAGKGLSTNDYTTTEKNKLAGIAPGAEVNVQSDWNQTNDTEDNYIQNKPTIPTVPTNVSAFTNDAGYLTSHQSLANYYTKTEVDSLVGDIETVLDTIMGV